ncbi:MAG: hypothetical protein ABI758_06510 [Candidatus Woesebacteria bacterium]
MSTESDDRDWSDYLDDLTTSTLEESTLCYRVHPTMRLWLIQLLAEPREINVISQEILLLHQKSFRKSEFFKNFKPSNSEHIIELHRRLLLDGRSVLTPRRREITEDSPELKQAMNCLMTEILEATFGGIETLDFPILKLAEEIFGEHSANMHAGILAIGFLFQTSIEAEEFDDL